jgi:hypothetical protein
MVAWEQVPMNIDERPHPLQWRTQGVRVGSLAVVDISCDENVPHAVTLCVLAEPLDGGEARLPQCLFLCAKLLEDLADLPVGGMYDSQVVIPLSRR